ncbi:MAG: hypothetical protein GWP91_00600 [Rhodobacterales bacterium]|nr:hypothetical protein [Rhodobacterales bacterium]
MSLLVPEIAEFVATALHHASGVDDVVSGKYALLLALALEDGELKTATQLLTHTPLKKSVAEGLLAQAQLTSSELSALIHLAMLTDGGETVVGLQIDIRSSKSPALCRFGAPMGADKGRPELRGDLWAMNDAAFDALAIAGHVPQA